MESPCEDMTEETLLETPECVPEEEIYINVRSQCGNKSHF